MMPQSRKMSAIESITNVVVGYLFAVGAQFVIFPLFDVHISVAENLLMGLFFTIISMARQYILRRLFNAIREPSL